MKSYRQIVWLLALSLLLVLAACGPAVSDEELASAEATAAAMPADGDDHGEEAADADHSEEADAGSSEEADADHSEDAETGTEGETETETGSETAVLPGGGTVGYEEVEAGDGATPAEGDIYAIHFVLTLEDGTVIFDSYDQGQPLRAVLGSGQGLPGWEEGLTQMQAGGKANLTIPPEKAFGEQGQPSLGVPPNAVILAEMELIDVIPGIDPRPIPDGELETIGEGLQIFDFVVGDGAQPALGDQVQFRFNLWENGNLVDSSSLTEDLPPFQLGAQQWFPGFEDIMTSMQVGGERAIVFPPELSGGADLVMEIALLDVIVSQVQPVPDTWTAVAEDDYVTTESGLQYYDIEEGTGDMPEAGQAVAVQYTGWLLEDGSMFDSSLNRGFPFEFVLGTGSVIAGWDEGVATMKVGGKRQLVIPAELGYGESGSGAAIPPGATLVFEVELLSINGQ